MIENKLGFAGSPELAEAEEKLSKKRAVELFESGMLDKLEAGKFASLKAIHKYLFDDIYFFAGEIRTVNIAKGNLGKYTVGNFKKLSKTFSEASIIINSGHINIKTPNTIPIILMYTGHLGLSSFASLALNNSYIPPPTINAIAP